MEYKIKEIFERADIKQIREFLIGGTIVANDYYGTYEERLDRNSEDIVFALKRITKDDTDDSRFNEATNDLILALMTYKEVYSEIGMKIGARLMFQLLFEDD